MGDVRSAFAQDHKGLTRPRSPAIPQSMHRPTPLGELQAMLPRRQSGDPDDVVEIWFSAPA
jgi:hypothetical protein